MSEQVQIVRLEPLHVAAGYGFGSSPEEQAWKKLLDWAGGKGLLDNVTAHRFFGFNNPSPAPGSPNYGYELWIMVGPDVEPEGEVRILNVPGAHYAVTRCKVPEGELDNIGATWKKLAAWREDSKYKCGSHQWLEQSVSLYSPGVGFILDLYLPITD